MYIFAKLTTLDAGYPRDKQTINTLVEKGELKLNNIYRLQSAVVGNSYTDVWLEELPAQALNSVFFTFYDQNGQEIDIYDEAVMEEYPEVLHDY